MNESQRVSLYLIAFAAAYRVFLWWLSLVGVHTGLAGLFFAMGVLSNVGFGLVSLIWFAVAWRKAVSPKANDRSVASLSLILSWAILLIPA